MKIGGHGLGEHLRLLAPLFWLIAGVWALRLVLAAAGAPFPLVRACSVSVTGAVAILLAVILIHIRRFGGYVNVAVAAFLLECCLQLLIVAAIAFAALTGIQNIYTAPEFSFRLSSLTHHMVGHLTFGIGVGTLMGTAMGSLLLWLLRRLVPVKSAQ